MSSSNSLKDRGNAEALGVSAYFCKPLELDAFMKLGEIARSALAGDNRTS